MALLGGSSVWRTWHWFAVYRVLRDEWSTISRFTNCRTHWRYYIRGFIPGDIKWYSVYTVLPATWSNPCGTWFLEGDRTRQVLIMCIILTTIWSCVKAFFGKVPLFSRLILVLLFVSICANIGMGYKLYELQSAVVCSMLIGWMSATNPFAKSSKIQRDNSANKDPVETVSTVSTPLS